MKKLRKILRDARRRLMTMAWQAWDMLRAFCWVCLLAAEEPNEYEREFGQEKKTR